MCYNEVICICWARKEKGMSEDINRNTEDSNDYNIPNSEEITPDNVDEIKEQFGKKSEEAKGDLEGILTDGDDTEELEALLNGDDEEFSNSEESIASFNDEIIEQSDLEAQRISDINNELGNEEGLINSLEEVGETEELSDGKDEIKGVIGGNGDHFVLPETTPSQAKNTSGVNNNTNEPIVSVEPTGQNGQEDAKYEVEDDSENYHIADSNTKNTGEQDNTLSNESINNPDRQK